jgi:hypothetical protein
MVDLEEGFCTTTSLVSILGGCSQGIIVFSVFGYAVYRLFARVNFVLAIRNKTKQRNEKCDWKYCCTKLIFFANELMFWKVN